jgi:hypothetical protein
MRRYSRSRVRETTYPAAHENIGETWTGSRGPGGKAKAAPPQFQHDDILTHGLESILGTRSQTPIDLSQCRVEPHLYRFVVPKKGHQMFKILLVPLFGQDGDKEALEAADELLLDEGGHLNCLYVHDDAAAITSFVQADAMGAPVVTPQLIDMLNEDARAQKAKARRTFDHFCETHGLNDRASPGVALSASWHEISGDMVESISRAARYNDAVVLKRGPEFTDPSLASVGGIAIGAGRAVLLFPKHWQPRPIRCAAVAWKDTPEAARADRLTCLAGITASGSKFRTCPAIRVGSPVGSKASIVAIPDVPAHRASHVVATFAPTGVNAPKPVIRTSSSGSHTLGPYRQSRCAVHGTPRFDRRFFPPCARAACASAQTRP